MAQFSSFSTLILNVNSRKTIAFKTALFLWMIRCLQAWRAMVFCLLTQFKAKQNSIEEAFQKCKTKQINIIKCNIRNSKNLTKAEDIKKRCQEYTEELYKKDLHDPDNHDGVITHLEPDILECEVKWALESITSNKASGGDGIPVEQFQILKDNALKVLHSICQQIWKTQQWPWHWKRSVFITIPKKGNAKECSNYHRITLISHTSKVMLKILQARLQQYMNWELPNVQAGFRKGRGTRDQMANIRWIIGKAREFQKNIYFCFID